MAAEKDGQVRVASTRPTQKPKERSVYDKEMEFSDNDSILGMYTQDLQGATKYSKKDKERRK